MSVFCCWIRKHNNKKNPSAKIECAPSNTQSESIVSLMDRGAEIKVLESDDFLRSDMLGSGISSEVYLLERKSDHKKLAGKFFKGDVVLGDFIRETKILHSCSSACATIVNMVGYMTKPKCLVMEYYVHGSLSVALQEDRKNVNRGQKTEFIFLQRLSYILDMCKAVTELHQRNICHRDIALRNLLLSNDKKRVLLTDFSLSRVVSSPMMKQLTLTTIVPRESAPETLAKHTRKIGRKAFEREYSLKSDIWLMGTAMYGIIDRGYNEGQKWQKEPSGFPPDSKPSSDVFKRTDELWILILRCWCKTPEDRPQSWDLEDKVQRMLDNPLGVVNDQDAYLTKYSSPEPRLTAISNWETPDLSNIQSPYQLSTMGRLFENDMLSCRSLNLANPLSSTWDQESFNKGSHVKIMMGDKNKSMKNLSCVLPKLNESNEYLTPYRPALGNRGMRSDPSIGNSSASTLLDLNKNKSDPLAPLGKTMSDHLTPSPHLKVNKGWKFVKRLGSIASIFTNSVSSLNETSSPPERDGFYAPPLNASLVSITSPTNIAYCNNRHFFKIDPGELGSSQYILQPELETVKEQSSSTLLDIEPIKLK